MSGLRVEVAPLTPSARVQRRGIDAAGLLQIGDEVDLDNSLVGNREDPAGSASG
jgi:hypothetical protein